MNTPDFNKLAGELLDDCSTREVAEQLRLLWNARGAADIAKIDAVVPTLFTPPFTPINTAAAAVATALDRALRELDVRGLDVF